MLLFEISVAENAVYLQRMLNNSVQCYNLVQNVINVFNYLFLRVNAICTESRLQASQTLSQTLSTVAFRQMDIHRLLTLPNTSLNIFKYCINSLILCVHHKFCILL